MKTPDPYLNRNTYRILADAADLTYFRVTEGETDLCIGAPEELKDTALLAVREAREAVEEIIRKRPTFLKSLSPLEPFGGEKACVLSMYRAGWIAGTGPMAAVAGMVAEYTGRALLKHVPEVTVENGGDVFLAGFHTRTVAVAAGTSPLSGRIGIKALPGPGFSVCTSSGTYGHSLSFGKADAAVVAAEDAALADAVATMLGNKCKTAADLASAVEWAAALEGVSGALAVMGDKLAAAGQIELVPLQG